MFLEIDPKRCDWDGLDMCRGETVNIFRGGPCGEKDKLNTKGFNVCFN